MGGKGPDPKGMGKGKEDSKGKGKEDSKGKGKGKKRPVDTTGNTVTAGISVFISLMWVGLIVGTLDRGWHYKMTHVWNFYVGLYNMEVNMDSLGGLAIKLIARAVDAGNSKRKGKSTSFSSNLIETFSRGEHTIQNIRDQMCNAEIWTGGLFSSMCEVWRKMLWASWAGCFAFSIAIFFLMFAAGCTCLPLTRCTRMTTYVVMIIALIFAGGGGAVYAALTFDFDLWLTDIGLAISMGTTFDKGFYGCCFCFILTLFPPMVLMCCGTKMPTIAESKEEDRLAEEADFLEAHPEMKGKKGKEKGDPFGKGPPMGGDPNGKGPPMGGDPYGKGP